MGVFHHGDGVHPQRLSRNVGDLDIADLACLAQGHKDGRLGAEAVEFGEDAGIAQADVAFEAIQRLQGGHEERREKPVALGGVKAQVERLALEVRGGHLRDVLGDAVEVGSSLQISAPPVWSTKPPNASVPI